MNSPTQVAPVGDDHDRDAIIATGNIVGPPVPNDHYGRGSAWTGKIATWFGEEEDFEGETARTWVGYAADETAPRAGSYEGIDLR